MGGGGWVGEVHCPAYVWRPGDILELALFLTCRFWGPDLDYQACVFTFFAISKALM